MPRTPGNGGGFGKSGGSGFRIPAVDELDFFTPEAPPPTLDTPTVLDVTPTLPETFAEDLPNAVVDAVITTTGLLTDHMGRLDAGPPDASAAHPDGLAAPVAGSVADPDVTPDRMIGDFDDALKQAKAAARNQTGRMLLEQNEPHLRDFFRGHVVVEDAARKTVAREDAVHQCIDTLHGLAAKRPQNFDDFASLLGDLIEAQGRTVNLADDRRAALRADQLADLARTAVGGLIKDNRFADALAFLSEAGDDLAPLGADEIELLREDVTTARAAHAEGVALRAELLRDDYLASLAETGRPHPFFDAGFRAALDADARAALPAAEALALEQFAIIDGFRTQPPDAITAAVAALRPAPNSSDPSRQTLFERVTEATERLLKSRAADPAAAAMALPDMRRTFDEAAQWAASARQDPGADAALAGGLLRPALAWRQNGQRRLGIDRPRVLTGAEAAARAAALEGDAQGAPLGAPLPGHPGDPFIDRLSAFRAELGPFYDAAIDEIAAAGLEANLAVVARITDPAIARAFAGDQAIGPEAVRAGLASAQIRAVADAALDAYAGPHADTLSGPEEDVLVDRALALYARARNVAHAAEKAADSLRRGLGREVPVEVVFRDGAGTLMGGSDGEAELDVGEEIQIGDSTSSDGGSGSSTSISEDDSIFEDTGVQVDRLRIPKDEARSFLERALEGSEIPHPDRQAFKQSIEELKKRDPIFGERVSRVFDENTVSGGGNLKRLGDDQLAIKIAQIKKARESIGAVEEFPLSPNEIVETVSEKTIGQALKLGQRELARRQAPAEPGTEAPSLIERYGIDLARTKTQRAQVVALLEDLSRVHVMESQEMQVLRTRVDALEDRDPYLHDRMRRAFDKVKEGPNSGNLALMDDAGVKAHIDNLKNVQTIVNAVINPVSTFTKMLRQSGDKELRRRARFSFGDADRDLLARYRVDPAKTTVPRDDLIALLRDVSGLHAKSAGDRRRVEDRVEGLRQRDPSLHNHLRPLFDQIASDGINRRNIALLDDAGVKKFMGRADVTANTIDLLADVTSGQKGIVLALAKAAIENELKRVRREQERRRRRE